MKVITGIAALMLMGALLQGCNEEAEVAETILRPVRYMVVEASVNGRTRSFSGISKSVRESRLSFKVGGTIAALPVQLGDQLKAGDLIAALDALGYELQVQQSEASLVQARANARNARANYERVKGLYENANASRNDLDSARANAESANAQQEAAQKSLELARLNLSYTELKAEVDCSISSLDVDLNENITAGTQVARVNCSEELEIEISVSEGIIAAVRQGMKATVGFAAIPGKSFVAEVAEVGASSVGAGSTFPVTVKIMEAHPGLRSGLAAEVALTFGQAGGTKRKLVPLSSVMKGSQGAYVYLAAVTPDSQVAEVKKRAVTLGELTDEGLEVFDGLVPGDRVITAGVSVIREGQRVLIR